MASSSIYFSRAKCADTEKRAVPFGVQLKRASAEEARLLRKLEDASLKGDEGKTRFYKGCYLRSFAAKLVAVVRAGRMLKAKGRPHLSDEQALGLARDLRLSQLCTEEVRVFPKLKDGGTSYRPMQSFGQEHRARKWLLTRVLNATAKLDRRQYGVQGGRTAACKQVLEAMRTCKFAVQIDIKNFFPSVNRNWLGQKLGIGRELVERNLLSTNAELRVRDGDRYPYGYAG